jgi:hypothetical protein
MALALGSALPFVGCGGSSKSTHGDADASDPRGPASCPEENVVERVPGQRFEEQTIATIEQLTRASLAIGQSGEAHVAYASWFTGACCPDANYATNADGTWASRMVLGTGHGGAPAPEIALDAKGAVHVAHRGGRLNLLYATNREGDWVSTDVQEKPGFDISLVVDPEGAAQIFASRGSDLAHFAERDDVWAALTVLLPAEPDTLMTLTATRDEDGAYHLFYEGSASRCHYAGNAAGTWISEPIPDVLGASAIVPDDAGGAWILAGGVLHRRSADGSWTHQVFDESAPRAAGGVLEVEPSGNARIGYALGTDAESGLYSVTGRDGSWQRTRVWDSAEVAALAFDAAGLLHFVTHDTDSDSLRYYRPLAATCAEP